MSWKFSRGTAINKEKKKDNDLKKIKIKITYIVNKELESFNKKRFIFNNQYGEWINK